MVDLSGTFILKTCCAFKIVLFECHDLFEMLHVLFLTIYIKNNIYLLIFEHIYLFYLYIDNDQNATNL